MAYDEFLAERIQRIYTEKKIPFTAKKMFGGVCFLIDEKMCTGVIKAEMMVRIDPDINDEQLKHPGARPMDFSGKSMKGFIMVDPLNVDMEEDLEYWIDLALAYNPKAKASKK